MGPAMAMRTKSEFIRIGQKSDGKTRLIAPERVLEAISLKEENYGSYALYRGGQSDSHVTTLDAVVIDLDAKHQNGGVATEQQVRKIGDMVPSAALVWANGVQVVLRPPLPKNLTNIPEADRLHAIWRYSISDLVVLGEFLEKETGLHYDRGCHVTKDNLPAAHRGHPYRLPGWAKKASRPVQLYAPLTIALGTTTDAVNHLGLTTAPIRKSELRAISTPSTTPHNLHGASRSNGSHRHRGSHDDAHVEYSNILRLWCKGVYKDGKPRAIVEAGLCSTNWTHHTGKHLTKALKCLKVYSGLNDGRRLTADQWKAVQNDLETLQLIIGPCSAKRRRMQRTLTVRASRAWSFEWLYWFKHHYGWALEDCIQAFWNWSQFRTIRELSMAAVGSVQEINEDLQHCWQKWSDGGGADEVSPDHIRAAMTAILAIKAKTFTRAQLQTALGWRTRTRLLQRALKELVGVGQLERKGRGPKTCYVRVTS
jgi:hypothetical protein